MKTLILVGLGNTILSDDGVGVVVVEEVARGTVPSFVQVVPAGADPWMVWEVLDGGCRGPRARDIRWLVVDAVLGGEPPGSIYRIPLVDLQPEPASVYSLHDHRFAHLLGMKEIFGYRPEGLLLGVEPAVLEFGTTLSRPVRRAIPKLLDLVHQEFYRLTGEGWLQPGGLVHRGCGNRTQKRSKGHEG